MLARRYILHKQAVTAMLLTGGNHEAIRDWLSSTGAGALQKLISTMTESTLEALEGRYLCVTDDSQLFTVSAKNFEGEALLFDSSIPFSVIDAATRARTSELGNEYNKTRATLEAALQAGWSPLTPAPKTHRQDAVLALRLYSLSLERGHTSKLEEALAAALVGALEELGHVASSKLSPRRHRPSGR